MSVSSSQPRYCPRTHATTLNRFKQETDKCACAGYIEYLWASQKFKWRASWTWQHSGADTIMCQDDRGEFWVICLMSKIF